jgi:hypothetical protein
MRQLLPSEIKGMPLYISFTNLFGKGWQFALKRAGRVIGVNLSPWGVYRTKKRACISTALC